MTKSFEEAVKEAELITLLVGHDQFKQVDPNHLAGLTSTRLMLDTVNGWDASEWQKAGFQLAKLGKGKR